MGHANCKKCDKFINERMRDKSIGRICCSLDFIWASIIEEKDIHMHINFLQYFLLCLKINNVS
jgi:hypothetical protein